MKNSKIEWTTHTFNPWIGCTKVSPGCALCYAETLMDHRMGRAKWGPGNPRSRTSSHLWNEPLKWNKEALVSEVLHPETHERPRVFCASLSDWLDDEVSIEWLVDLFTLIRSTPNLDWLLLTKRPENWPSRIEGALKFIEAHPLWDAVDNNHILSIVRNWLADWFVLGIPPGNIWMGTSVENQEMAQKRIPVLLSIPAKVRFLSCEPLLGEISFRWLWTPKNWRETQGKVDEYECLRGDRIHWVIVGGESGPNARPMAQKWARDIRDQCEATGIPFLFKQWGAWGPCPDGGMTDSDLPYGDSVFGEFHSGGKWAESCLCSEGDGPLCRVGKKTAGRILEGRVHDGYPTNGLAPR